MEKVEVTARWSERVKELERLLDPYFARDGGLKEGSPPEAEALYEEFKKRVEEEAWL